MTASGASPRTASRALADSTPWIKLERAAFGYGGQRVLGAVDLAIERGGMIGVLGPNGSGKTTLFRGIAGLIKPQAGKRVAHVERIGYVPQREALDALYPLTVAEVVEMGAYGRLSGLHRLARAERELARECLQRVGLAGSERAAFSGLSGGQRQRALFARALMARPQVLLLDEPTSGVDRAAAARIEALALELVGEGATVLWVSHHLDSICRVATEILWVDRGGVRTLPPALASDAAALAQLYSGAPAGPSTGAGTGPGTGPGNDTGNDTGHGARARVR